MGEGTKLVLTGWLEGSSSLTFVELLVLPSEDSLKSFLRASLKDVNCSLPREIKGDLSLSRASFRHVAPRLNGLDDEEAFVFLGWPLGDGLVVSFSAPSVATLLIERSTTGVAVELGCSVVLLAFLDEDNTTFSLSF